MGTSASGNAAHAEGMDTTASGNFSHSEGSDTSASGSSSHAEGYGTIASRKSQHVFGEYNVEESGSTSEHGEYVEIVGNGTADDARSNARTLDWSGNEVLAGKLTVGAAPTADMDAATKKYVDDSVQNIDGANVNVEAQEEISILNTNSPALGETVYFRDYPDITWQVQHLDGDYAYLALYPMTERTTFGSNTTYSDSTIAQKCTDYLNNTIPNVADYLESVTVNSVTAKVFIPSYEQLSSEWDWPKASDSNRICQLNGSNGMYWTSTAYNSSGVWHVFSNGAFTSNGPSDTRGFRPAVKVRYKGTRTTTKDLNTALNDISEAVSNVNPYVIGTTAPTNTSKLWIDTTATTGGLKYYNGSAWVHVPTAFTS